MRRAVRAGLIESSALVIGLTMILAGAACSYFDQHPPQVCITADAMPDGGLGDASYVTIHGDAGPARNPGF